MKTYGKNVWIMFIVGAFYKNIPIERLVLYQPKGNG